MTNKARLLIAALALLAVVVSGGIVQAQSANRGRSIFDWVDARRVTVGVNGLTVTGATTVDDITVADDATVTDDLAVLDDATIAGDFVLPVQIVITVTNGVAFTPTGSIQVLGSAGTVTPTITIPAAGKTVCIYNRSSTTINFADASNQVLAGAFAMGQYDVLCGWSDGTRFIETRRSNN